MPNILETLKDYLIKKSNSKNKTFAVKTFQNYISVIKVLLRFVNYPFDKKGFPKNIDWLIENYESILDALKEGNININKKSEMSNQSKRNYYIVMINLIKSSDDKDLDDILNIIESQSLENEEEINNFLDQKKMTDRQSKNYVPLDKLKKVLEYWKDNLAGVNSKNDFNELAIWNALNFLINQSSIRAELANTKIIWKDEEELDNETNYIILNPNNNNGILLINTSKTSQIYGPTSIILLPQIVKELKNLKKYMSEYSPSNYFIVSREGGRVSQSYFSNLLADAIGKFFPDKRIGVNLIRTITASDLYKLDREQDRKKIELARVQQHSLKTQEKHYTKYLE